MLFAFVYDATESLIQCLLHSCLISTTGWDRNLIISPKFPVLLSQQNVYVKAAGHVLDYLHSTNLPFTEDRMIIPY